MIPLRTHHDGCLVIRTAMTNLTRDAGDFWRPRGGLVLQSRVHQLRQGEGLWLKRDDELSFGAGGTKLRKYASLIPHLVAERVDEVALLGGAGSNNVLTALQLLHEARIPCRLYLLRPDGEEPTVMGRLTALFSHVPTTVFSRAEWHTAAAVASDYRADEERRGRRVFVLPEGAAVPEAWPGLFTLGFDILRNEAEVGRRFDDIVIDAGTGSTAQSLTAFFALLAEERTVHVVLMAGSAEEFLARLHVEHAAMAARLHLASAPPLGPIAFYEPPTARAFGAVNRAVLNEVQRVATTEGVLIDPVYMAKVFLTLPHIKWRGNTRLVVHSGGGLGLLGYLPKFF